MSDGQVFQKSTKKKLVKFLDDTAKLPWYLEPFDGPGFKMLVDMIDEKADKFIPDEIDSLLDEGLILALDDKFNEASEKLGSAINKVVDIPNLEENEEQDVYVTGALFILRFTRNKVNLRKNN